MKGYTLPVLVLLTASLVGLVAYSSVHLVEGWLSIPTIGSGGENITLLAIYYGPNPTITAAVNSFGSVEYVYTAKVVLGVIQPVMPEEPLVLSAAGATLKRVEVSGRLSRLGGVFTLSATYKGADPAGAGSVVGEASSYDNIVVLEHSIYSSYAREMILVAGLDRYIEYTSGGASDATGYCQPTMVRFYITTTRTYLNYDRAWLCPVTVTGFRRAGYYLPATATIPGVGPLNLTPTVNPTNPQGVLMLSAFLALFLALSQFVGWRLALSMTGMVMALYAGVARVELLFVGGVVAVVGGLLLYYLTGRS